MSHHGPGLPPGVQPGTEPGIKAGEGDQTGGLDAMLDSVLDHAIFSVDLAGTITDWNIGAERLTGYVAHEVIGQPIDILYPPKDQANERPALALQMAREDGRFEEEAWRLRKDATRFPAQTTVGRVIGPDGSVAGYAVVLRDLSERMQAAEALHQSQELFRRFIDSVVDYAIYTLDLHGMITSWNAGAERIKGYTAAEVVGRHVSTFCTEADRRAGEADRALAEAATVGHFSAECWRVRKDGSQFRASIVINPVFSSDGDLLGFVKITRDITDRYAMEQARERAQQAQKMEAIGHLTAGVAHDFNNLLTTIAGSVDLMGRYSGDARVGRLAETVHHAIERGQKLNAQLLTFAGRQRQRPVLTDLNGLIRVFEALLERAVSDAVTLRLDLDPQLDAVLVDQGQFQSAVLNLVVNAREAMTKGGTLTIETRNVTLSAEEAAALGELAAGPHVAVAVRDTGAGMSEAVRQRAVEPFFSTKPPGLGSGLGLSQVHGFARQSAGGLEIESRENEGTVVRLLLPRAAVEPKPAQAGLARERPAILLVEDDPEVREIAAEALEGSGYQVFAAEDAHQALSILQRGVPIDALFTDVVMPHGVDGVELANQARALRPDLPVLLASGYARETLRTLDAAHGDTPFIAKPYRMAELQRVLRRLTQRPGAKEPGEA